jgi:predicted porin
MRYSYAICACSALLCVSGVHAEESAPWAMGGGSSVTLYGSLDEALEYITNQAVGKTTTNSVREGWGTDTSYWGIRGSEDLGGGMHAIFDLQGGFTASNGEAGQGGRLFGRQSYVGLTGDFGIVTFGRQYTMRAYAVKPINPFGFGSHGLTTLDDGIANPRADNAVSYRYHIGDFEAGVNYSFGRDTVDGDTKVATNCPGETSPSNECREYSAMAKYETSRWGLTTAWEDNYGGTSATYGGLTSPKLTDSRFILGGYVNIDKARVGLGWIKRDDEGIATPKSNLVWLSGTLQVTTALSFATELGEIKYEDSPNKAMMIAVHGVYSLSKSTALYLSVEHLKNGGKLAFAASTITPIVDPVPGGQQTSVVAGIRHQF